MQRHTAEIISFQFDDALFLGMDPVEDIRVIKNNMAHIPCLCVSSYNDRISLDMTFSDIANPSALIQGFLAELEQLQAMFR